MIPVSIHENELEDIVRLLRDIPEFENTPDETTIRHRIAGVPHLILSARIDQKVAGFKIGYERDGRFYSWLGAVHPRYRGSGIAQALADYQEGWAKRQGYKMIWMKTRNAFPAMLLMALRRGFRITSVEPYAELKENRIVLEKPL